MTKALPKPTSMLNMGPTKQPAMAITGCPALAKETSATRSPTELPQAKTVRPSTAWGMFKMVPMTARQLSSSPAMVEIQNTLIMKAKKVISMFSESDWGGADSRKKWAAAREKPMKRMMDHIGKYRFGIRKIILVVYGTKEFKEYRSNSGHIHMFDEA